MEIGLLPLDSKFPNLALMKLSTYHKSKGDHVYLMESNYYQPDILYVSVIFPKNKASALGIKHLYPDTKVIYGGSGVNYQTLEHNIEHCMPDYDLYGIDHSMGFTTRGCIKQCDYCIVQDKEGSLIFNAFLNEFVDDRFDKLILLDNNLLAFQDHIGILEDIKDRNLKVDFNQGLDITLIDKDNAKLLSELRYYNHHFDKRTLRFSFDSSLIKNQLIKGVKLLLDNGVNPKHLFFYILARPEYIDDAVNRVYFIKDLGCVPFGMVLNQAKDYQSRKFRHWSCRPYYQFIDWKDFKY